MASKVRTIPMNVVGSKRILGFRLRNILEGVVLAFIVIAAISPIPFVPRIKIIFDVILGLAVFALSCYGVKDKSPSELVIDTIKYLSAPKSWSLRSINYATQKSNTTNKKTTVTAEQSIAEKAFAFTKDKFVELKEDGKIPFLGNK